MDHHNITQDLKDAFHEAITCTTCKIVDLSKGTYRKHRESDYYNPLRDPPFLLPMHKYDTEVDPLCSINLDDHGDDGNLVSHAGTDSDTDTDTDTDSNIHIDTNARPNTYTNQKPQECGYNNIMTPRQRLFYHSLIDDYRNVDPTKDLLFARYCVDYHIHLHYLAARGMLNLCRNVEEMHEFRRWKWRLSMLEDTITSPSSSSACASSSRTAPSNDDDDADADTDDVSDSGIGSTSASTYSMAPSSLTTSSNATRNTDSNVRSDKESWQQANERYRHRRLHRWGWPDDVGFFMLYQTTLWREAWAARRERVADARAKWSIIADERWRQRRWGEWKNYWRCRDVRVGAYVHYDDSEGESQGEVVVEEESDDGSFSGSSFSCY